MRRAVLCGIAMISSLCNAGEPIVNKDKFERLKVIGM